MVKKQASPKGITKVKCDQEDSCKTIESHYSADCSQRVPQIYHLPERYICLNQLVTVLWEDEVLIGSR